MKAQKIAGSGFIIRADGRFLIVKRAKNDDFLPGSWEFPGGKIEFGEDVIDGTLREFREETGLNVKVEYPINVLTYIIEEPVKIEHHYVEIVFLCLMKNPKQAVTLSKEHYAYQWVTFEEVPNKDVSDLTRESLLKLQLFPAIIKREKNE